ncbi:MAG: hypothetical protein KC502_12815 [Myxococcales bacterium]|nr:hypothetical protein [Myxococcales bacterium]
MLDLDAELSEAMADAMAAVSNRAAPTRRSSTQLRTEAPPPQGASPAPASETSEPGAADAVDPDLLGALDAAISGIGVSDDSGMAPDVPQTTSAAVEPSAQVAPAPTDEPAIRDSLVDSLFDEPAAEYPAASDAATATAIRPDEEARESDGPPTEQAESTGDAATAEEAAERRSEQTRLRIAALGSWWHLIKVCAAPRANPRVAQTAATATVEAWQQAGGEWMAELRGHMWSVNGRWLPVPPADAATTTELAAILRRARCGGLWLGRDASAADVVAQTEAFVRVVRAKGAVSHAEGAKARFVPQPVLHANAESWVADVARRCADFAQTAQSRSEFPENTALQLIDELSQTLPTHTGALMRALELRPGQRTTPWAAATTCATTLATLVSLGISPRIRRSAALAIWALTLTPRRGETPPPLAEAAARVRWPALDATWSPVRAAARGLVVRLAAGGDSSVGMAPLVTLLFDAHRSRLLGAPDLLSALLKVADSPRQQPNWLPAVLTAVGPIPIGTAVRLADGAQGVVVDRAGDAGPLRPLVQVGTRMIRPTADVTPIERS